MPRVNIYIRKEDYEAWQNIPDKPKWIHEGLTTGHVLIPAKSVPVIKTKQDAEEVVEKIKSEPTTYKKTGSWGA